MPTPEEIEQLQAKGLLKPETAEALRGSVASLSAPPATNIDLKEMFKRANIRAADGAPSQPSAAPIPVGAVDAEPGTKLYDLAQKRATTPKHRQKSSEPDVWDRLMSKAVPGMARPGEGMVGIGDLPGTVRRSFTQPTVGFDPGKLAPDELELLMRLRQQGQQEVESRRPPDAPTPEQEKAHRDQLFAQYMAGRGGGS